MQNLDFITISSKLCVQSQATKLGKEHKASKGAEGAQPGEKEAQGDFTALYDSLKGDFSEVRSGLFSQGASDRPRKTSSSCTRGGLD